MKNSFRNVILAAFALSLLVSVTACGRDDVASPNSGRMRFFNAIFDSPTAGMDVFIDGTPVNLRNWLTTTPLTDSTFRLGAGFPGNTDSSYLFLTEGSHSIKINSPVGSGTTIFSQDVNIEANKTYVSYFIDSVAKASLIIRQDVLPAPKTGRAFIRVAHLAPTAPTVDAMVRFVKTSNTNVVTYVDSLSIASGATYKAFSEYVEVKAPDSLIVEFRPAGTTRAATTLSKISLVAGRCYTVIARGKTLGASSIIQAR